MSKPTAIISYSILTFVLSWLLRSYVPVLASQDNIGDTALSIYGVLRSLMFILIPYYLRSFRVKDLALYLLILIPLCVFALQSSVYNFIWVIAVVVPFITVSNTLVFHEYMAKEVVDIDNNLKINKYTQIAKSLSRMLSPLALALLLFAKDHITIIFGSLILIWFLANEFLLKEQSYICPKLPTINVLKGLKNETEPFLYLVYFWSFHLCISYYEYISILKGADQNIYSYLFLNGLGFVCGAFFVSYIKLTLSTLKRIVFLQMLLFGVLILNHNIFLNGAALFLIGLTCGLIVPLIFHSFQVNSFVKENTGFFRTFQAGTYLFSAVSFGIAKFFRLTLSDNVYYLYFGILLIILIFLSVKKHSSQKP